MLVLHTDLDSTLIYSEKRSIGIPKTCVEYLDGKPLSYMLDTSKEKLSKVLNIKDILVVPTTARSKEQFHRINLPNFEFAIVSNGGILLRNGIIDKDWYDYSLSLVEVCSDLLKELRGILKHDSNVCSEVTFNENLFLRVLSSNPEETIGLLKKYVGDTDIVSIYSLSNKVYVFPKNIDKNSAIERFKSIYNRDFTILADDSLHNYSDCVDLFLTTDNRILGYDYSNVKLVDGFLSESVLDLALDWRDKHE